MTKFIPTSLGHQLVSQMDQPLALDTPDAHTNESGEESLMLP